jgi:hypothetical protein
MKTNLMHYLFLIYFVKQPLYVSGVFITHHQKVFTVYVQQMVRVKEDSYIPFRSAKGLDLVSPIWFTQSGRIWFAHAMPFPCHATNMPFWKRPIKPTAGSRQGNGMVCVN